MAELFKECFSERFRREMEITKAQAKKYKSKCIKKGGGLERKRSVEYMEECE